MMPSTTYAPAEFSVATFNSLGEDATTRNMMDGHMDGLTDYL